MSKNRETLAEAVSHLLWAVDGTEFDPSVRSNAYITALRIAYEAETGKSGYPRETYARVHRDFARLMTGRAA